MSHDNLVPMLNCSWESEMMIVLPFYELGSLRTVLEDRSWREDKEHLTWTKNGTLLKLAIGIASGMQFLHEFKDTEGNPKPIYHRDLKGDNILIEGRKSGSPAEWNARISDFGESKEAYDETMTQTGTPHYMAPEGACWLID